MDGSNSVAGSEHRANKLKDKYDFLDLTDESILLHKLHHPEPH